MILRLTDQEPHEPLDSTAAPFPLPVTDKPKRQSKNSSERMSPYPVSSILKISMTGDLSCRRMRQTPSEVTVDLRTKRRISSRGCYRAVMHRYLGYLSCLRRSASVDERGKTR